MGTALMEAALRSQKEEDVQGFIDAEKQFCEAFPEGAATLKAS